MTRHMFPPGGLAKSSWEVSLSYFFLGPVSSPKFKHIAIRAFSGKKTFELQTFKARAVDVDSADLDP